MCVNGWTVIGDWAWRLGGEGDKQRVDVCGDERAARFGVVASEHDFYLLIVWELSLRVLFIVE